MYLSSRLLKKVSRKDENTNPTGGVPSSSYVPPSPYQQLSAVVPSQSTLNSKPSPPPFPSRQQLSPAPSWLSTGSQSSLQYSPPAAQAQQLSPYLRQPSPNIPPRQVLSSLPPKLPSTSPAPNAHPTVDQSASDLPRQKSSTQEPPQVRKILSLDGGGVRGLSIIAILKYIMKNLNQERGYDLEPWEEFDMIGGTSTGGYVKKPSKRKSHKRFVGRTFQSLHRKVSLQS